MLNEMKSRFQSENKKILLLTLTALITGTLYAQTATPPAAGDGSEGSPFEIATLENLYWLSQNSQEWYNKHYIQIADIDASTTSTWDSGAGFTPIGSDNASFQGSYDGQEHTIDSLFINRPSTDNIGLFGITESATIENLGIINSNIMGYVGVGSLVGNNNSCNISVCYSTGTITANDYYAGGLVGSNSQGVINNCYSKGAVNGKSAGGLVGFNSYDGIINNCYSTGSILSNIDAGGLIGVNYGDINNCYSTGTVTCDKDVGGLVGYMGNFFSTITNSFWDIETSIQATSAGGTGKTTAEMKEFNTFTDTTTTGLTTAWDFEKNYNNDDNNEQVWDMDLNGIFNNGYPFLSWQNGNEIALGVEDEQTPLGKVENFTVLPAYPNPFNPSTTIRYSHAVETHSNASVQIQIYDITGKLVTTLFNGEQSSGWHSIVWNGTNSFGKQVPAGVYLSRVSLGNEVKTAKLMLLR